MQSSFQSLLIGSLCLLPALHTIAQHSQDPGTQERSAFEIVGEDIYIDTMIDHFRSLESVLLQFVNQGFATRSMQTQFVRLSTVSD